MLKARAALATATVFIVSSYTGAIAKDYETSHKALYDHISVSFTEEKEIEYGSGEYDMMDFVSNYQGHMTCSDEKISTAEVGLLKLAYSVSETDRYGNVAERDYIHGVKVVDTQAPIIELGQDNMEIFLKSQFVGNENVVRVYDVVDGELSYSETLEPNTYTVNSEVNVAKKGTYKVTVTAMDINGNITEADYNVKVVRKTVLIPGVDYTWKGQKLTKKRGTIYGPSGKETYYNLRMNGVIRIMRRKGFTEEKYPYWIREDGCKMLGDYIMVAAHLGTYPRGSVIKTSLGMGLVCDTGAFARKNPYQIDIAVNW